MLKATDQLGKRTLSGTVFSDNADHFARINCKAYILKILPSFSIAE